MSTLTLIMFLVGLFGIVGSVVYLVISLIRKKDKKKGLKIFGGFIVLVLLSLILKPNTESTELKKSTTTNTTITEKEEIKPQQSSSETTNSPSPTNTPKEKTWSTGTYLVGTDIQAGLYKVKLTDTVMKLGYVERAKDVSMATSDIIANIILTGDGYVEINSSDKAVRLSGVELAKVDYAALPVNIKTELSDGIYLVNKDLKPGTYKVIITDTNMKMGYVERSKNVSMGTGDIIANELFQGDGYVKILSTDYAVRLQGVKLIFQN